MKLSIQSTVTQPEFSPTVLTGYDALHDYTIIDKVRDNYWRLKHEQDLHNIKKQQPKKKWWEIWN